MAAAEEIASRSVAWWPVYTYVQSLIEQMEVGCWPMAGTPTWLGMSDDDPVKLAAVLDAGQHHALRLELNQEAQADASRAVSTSADWPGIANEIRRRRDVYIPARRAAS